LVDVPDLDQLLVRAAMFRIIRASMVDWATAEDRLRVYQQTVADLETRVQ